MWVWLSGFLVIGYLSLTRSFAYLGVPPLKIFIGEIALALFIVLRPGVAIGSWASALVRPSPLNRVAIAVFVFLAYGAWEVCRGILEGASPITTLKNFVFNYYVIYFFFGLWVSLKWPDFLLRLVWVLAWVNGVYGIAFATVLKSLGVLIPGTNVILFGQPAGSAVAILGLICLERNLARAALPIALNVIVLLAMQVRAEWLGVSLALIAWGTLTGRLGRLVSLGLVGLAVLGAIELADIQIAGRGGPVSLGNIIGRVLAPVSTDLAAEFSEHAEDDAGTVEWRTQWWEQIWAGVHKDPITQMIGFGYGFDLFSLAPLNVRNGQDADIRTPHNVIYYALGYTGWIGVAAFALLQLSLARLLWQSYRTTGQSFGITFWIMGMAQSLFSNFFETPYAAVPFYLLIGMAAAPAVARLSLETRNARIARAQLLSAARR